jgi:hypothetical protein
VKLVPGGALLGRVVIVDRVLDAEVRADLREDLGEDGVALEPVDVVVRVADDEGADEGGMRVQVQYDVLESDDDVKKIGRNVARSFICKNEYITFSVAIKRLKICTAIRLYCFDYF